MYLLQYNGNVATQFEWLIYAHRNLYSFAKMNTWYCNLIFLLESLSTGNYLSFYQITCKFNTTDLLRAFVCTWITFIELEKNQKHIHFGDGMINPLCVERALQWAVLRYLLNSHVNLQICFMYSWMLQRKTKLYNYNVGCQCFDHYKKYDILDFVVILFFFSLHYSNY